MLFKAIVPTVLLAAVAVAEPAAVERNILDDVTSAVVGAFDTVTAGAASVATDDIVGAFSTATAGAASVATDDIVGAFSTATSAVGGVGTQVASAVTPGSGAPGLLAAGTVATVIAAAGGVVVGAALF